MVLEIDPTETFNQIKEINQLMYRRTQKNQKTGDEQKQLFSIEDEIELRAFILENVSSDELTKITDLVEKCKSKGYDQDNIVKVINRMIQEKILETLNKKFVVRIDDSD